MSIFQVFWNYTISEIKRLKLYSLFIFLFIKHAWIRFVSYGLTLQKTYDFRRHEIFSSAIWTTFMVLFLAKNKSLATFIELKSAACKFCLTSIGLEQHEGEFMMTKCFVDCIILHLFCKMGFPKRPLSAWLGQTGSPQRIMLILWHFYLVAQKLHTAT